MTNPYLLDGPALISFSGGRTSAYMLHQILAANGGLPKDTVVAFANTGKEREETLRFVHDCETNWGVKVYWLEWRDADQGFEEVGFNSAAREGEPFAALIAKKKFLPNAVTRFCTQILKVETMRDFCRSLGWERWVNVIGLRYDEGWRVLKALDRNEARKDRFTAIMPLSKAKVTKRDVMAFWAKQPFDLQLEPHEGNCDLCFLKSVAKRQRIMRDRPDLADWWIGQERTTIAKTAAGARFTTEYSYADLAREVSQSPLLPFIDDGDEYDAECGLICAAERPANDHDERQLTVPNENSALATERCHGSSNPSR